MLPMSGQPVRLPFDGGRVVVAADGGLEFLVDGLGGVRCSVVGAQFTPVLVEPDVAEHEGTAGGLEVGQRVTAGEHCQLRWAIDVPEQLDDPGLVVQVEVGDRQLVWLWPSGADGLLVVLPRSGTGPVLALHAVQAELRLAESAGDSDPATVVRLVVTPRDLGPGRQVVVLRALVLPTLLAAGSLLPAWFESLTLEAGEEWTAPLADLGVDSEPPVELALTERAAEIRLLAPAGRHRVGVHGRRGVTDLVFEVAPPIAALFSELAGVLGEVPVADGASAFVLHRALVSGAVSRTTAIEDALDRFDWSSKPGALAVAFGSERALADGEPAMAREAQRRAAELPPGLGRPRVRSLAWLVAAALGLDALLALGADPESELPDDRPVTGDAATSGEGVEADLALARRSPLAVDGLAGAINALGAGLPGFPVGLGAVEQALLVGLLESCPEDWPEAPLAGATAQATRRRLLASYAAGRLTDPAPLAWLLVYG
ncbi:MAG: hypothetical protein VB093_06380 [Propionicimonas sp.]|nr:hypothetical protein [Propionicimonas sp.]